ALSIPASAISSRSCAQSASWSLARYVPISFDRSTLMPFDASRRTTLSSAPFRNDRGMKSTQATCEWPSIMGGGLPKFIRPSSLGRCVLQQPGKRLVNVFHSTDFGQVYGECRQVQFQLFLQSKRQSEFAQRVDAQVGLEIGMAIDSLAEIAPGRDLLEQ